MTVLQALAILESATLECKQREVNTLDVREALDFLEPHIQPAWVVPQFRHGLEGSNPNPLEREGQSQMLRATFPGIRESVRVLLEVRMDALARKFYKTKDKAIPEEIYRLGAELRKLKEEWRG